MIYDAIIIVAVDVVFEFIHRRGATDTVLATWSQHFEPLPGGVYEAQPFEIDQSVAALDVEAGDLFVWRFTGSNASAMQAFIPNGDGVLAKGRIPRIILPK